jgi:hypothetical protein
MTQTSAPSITVAGNVEGSIVVGDNNFVVNTNHGTIVYQQAAPRVQLREAMPQPPRKPRTFIGRTSELAQLEAGRFCRAGHSLWRVGPCLTTWQASCQQPCRSLTAPWRDR